jgi:hypothetical protein
VLTPSKPGPASLGADGSPAVATNPFLHSYDLKPLIPPMNAPGTASQHNFYAPVPVTLPAPVFGSASQTADAPKTDQSQDSTDIETPGMIAAEKNPLSDADTHDLTLEILPGETVEQAKADREKNTEKLELPLPMTADLLHKAQSALLTLQNPTTSAQIPVAAPAPAKTFPTEDPNAPIPVSKEPLIIPIRAPIADPYDILDR